MTTDNLYNLSGIRLRYYQHGQRLRERMTQEPSIDNRGQTANSSAAVIRALAWYLSFADLPAAEADAMVAGAGCKWQCDSAGIRIIVKQ